MLATLITSSLPSSVGELFEPPLDSHSLSASLIAGKLSLHGLRFNPVKMNELLGAASPVHVQRGSLRELTLQVDWQQLWSQPLLLTLAGLHLTITHAPVPMTTAAGAKEKHAEGVWKEEELLKLAETRKLAALEAAVPLEPGLLQKLQSAGEGGGSSSFFGAPLKKLVSFILTSLHMKVSDVRVEFESEEALSEELLPEGAKGPLSLPPHMAARLAAATHVPHARLTPVSVGFELKRSAIFESLSKEEVPEAPAAFNSLKEFQVELSLFCDVGTQAAAPEGSTARSQGLSQEQKPGAPAPMETERKEWSPKEMPQREEHDYLLEPTGCAFHMAFNNDLSSKLSLQARLLCEEVHAGLDPAQLQALCSIFATVMRYQAALQAEVHKVGMAHFHSASVREGEVYIWLVKRVMRGNKLSGDHTKVKDRLERQLLLKDLVLMRHSASQQVHEEDVRKEEEQFQAEHAAAPSSPSRAEEESMWDSITSFFSGLTASQERKPSEGQASPSSSGVGSIQSALEHSTPWILDVHVECVAEKLRCVLYEDARKSDTGALLALAVTNAAARVEAKPGGAVGIRVGLQQLSVCDVSHPSPPEKFEVPDTYIRMLPSDEIMAAVEKEIARGRAGGPFEMHSDEFYRAMPFLASCQLLTAAEATAAEQKLEAGEKPQAAKEGEKQSEHLNTVDLVVSGLQLQLLLTLASKIGRLPVMLQRCLAPLSSVPPAPLQEDVPRLPAPPAKSPLETISMLLPLRVRLAIGGGHMLSFLSGTVPTAEAMGEPSVITGQEKETAAEGESGETASKTLAKEGSGRKESREYASEASAMEPAKELHMHMGAGEGHGQQRSSHPRQERRCCGIL